MTPYGYHPVHHTPGLWFHNTCNTLFSLVVDDFFVQYTSKEDADHFLSALQDEYPITANMDAKTYIGINLKWDYINIKLTFSMPEYFWKALHKFQHILRGVKNILHMLVTPPNMELSCSMRTRCILRITCTHRKPKL